MLIAILFFVGIFIILSQKWLKGWSKAILVVLLIVTLNIVDHLMNDKTPEDYSELVQEDQDYTNIDQDSREFKQNQERERLISLDESRRMINNKIATLNNNTPQFIVGKDLLSYNEYELKSHLSDLHEIDDLLNKYINEANNSQQTGAAIEVRGSVLGTKIAYVTILYDNLSNYNETIDNIRKEEISEYVNALVTDVEIEELAKSVPQMR